jgi:hypothetical protein
MRIPGPSEPKPFNQGGHGPGGRSLRLENRRVAVRPLTGLGGLIHEGQGLAEVGLNEADNDRSLRVIERVEALAYAELADDALELLPLGRVRRRVQLGESGIRCHRRQRLRLRFRQDGDLVTLSAEPETGSTFAGWSGGGCGGTGTCEVTIEAATTVSASFTLNNYALVIETGGAGAGTVFSDPAGIECGTRATEPPSASERTSRVSETRDACVEASGCSQVESTSRPPRRTATAAEGVAGATLGVGSIAGRGPRPGEGQRSARGADPDRGGATLSIVAGDAACHLPGAGRSCEAELDGRTTQR